MPADQLEIVVITYNRAAELRRTLGRLADSPFAGCRVTVLDNHSTDETPTVCAQARDRLPCLEHVRHPRNIGGGPNYLRAVETSRAPYTWVLADDDELDFGDCGDVLAALEDGSTELICVGGPGRDGWPAGRTSLRTLVAEGRRVFHVLTFVPSLIFRTELFDDRDLSDGYRFVDDLYPNFPFVRRQVERDAGVLVSRREILLRGGVTLPSSHLYWFLRWVRCCASIADPELRRAAIYGKNATRRDWVVDLGAAYAQERLYFPERTGREVAELLLLLDGDQRMIALALAPIAFVPRALHAVAKALIKRIQGQPNVAGPEDAFHSLDARP